MGSGAPRRSATFAADPMVVATVDRIAKRRGKFVHEVLALSFFELSLEIACLSEAAVVTESIMRQAKGGLFPVFEVQQ